MEEDELFRAIEAVLLTAFIFFAAGALWHWNTDWFAGLIGFCYFIVRTVHLVMGWQYGYDPPRRR